MSVKRKCKFDIHQLTALCVEFKNISEEDQTPAFLQVKQDELERRWGKLLESYEAFVMDEKSEVSEDFKDGISLQYEAAAQMYQNLKSELLDKMANKSIADQNVSNLTEATVVRQSRSGLRLPPCDMPIFEGGYTKWPEFRDMFTSLVVGNKDISQVEKLQYLRTKVRGEAYQIVKRFDLVGQNFELAWEALQSRYENPRILVNQQIKHILSIQTAQNESSRSIRLIVDTIDEKIAILKTCQINVSSWDPILTYICSSKLPENTLRAWENSLNNHKEMPSWKDMSNFLKGRIEMLETVFDMKKPNWKENSASRSNSFHSQANGKRAKFNCRKCKENHPLNQCKQFLELSVKDRIKFVYANKYCSNCFSLNHFKSKCRSKVLCFRCKRKHHTLLHVEDENSRTFKEVSPRNEETVSYNTHVTSNEKAKLNTIDLGSFQHGRTTILPTALIYIQQAGELFTVRALLDAGSEKSFVSSKVQQQLAIPVKPYHSRISGLGGTVVGRSKGICSLTLRAKKSDFSITINAIIAPKLAHFLPSCPIQKNNLPDIETLDLADPYFYKPGPIDLIIGSDYLPFINLSGIKSNIENTLEARESHFGWYLSGPEPSQTYNSFSTLVTSEEEVALQEQMKRFWELEEVEKEKVESEHDMYCENFYRDTVKRHPEGRYTVRLPFKENYPSEIFLGSSKCTAYAQYLQMEKKLDKNPELKAQYQLVLQEYIDLGHMEEVNHQESSTTRHFSFFLPHHAVIRPESKSTKVRVVFNASKKTCSGFSLNDVLYQGPALQGDLMQIILSWRYYKYVFTGDIQKMYRQIFVHEEDRPYQKILFRVKPNESIKVFQLKTVTFGVNSAPYLAIRTLLELSEDCKRTHPLASSILKEEIYVDDVLSGGHNLEDAQEKQVQLSKALISAGFPLKKITSNHPALLENLAREDLLEEDFLKFENSSSLKTLGIRWNAKEDTFYYVPEVVEVSPSTTKRQILSTIAKLFDPLGWLGPIIIVAKLIMQELWE